MTQMCLKQSYVRFAVMAVWVIGTGLLLGSCGQTDRTAEIEVHKRLAGELSSNNLPLAAIEEYQKILGFENVTDQERGNISYLIARVYYDHLKDYRNAAAYYIRAKEYDPKGSYVSEASKNLVASLEKLGNVLDARRNLSAATDIDYKPRDSSDAVVAKIGQRNILLSEVEDQITLLPSDIQAQLTTREAKQQYIRQYVGVELLYAAALREDYLSKPEVQRQREMYEKRMLVDRFVADKIMPGIQIDTVDLRNFYRANKDSLYHGAPLDSVRAQVYQDYHAQKAEAAYNDYIMRLVQSEKVEFLDRNVK
jgi:tetratricopeptide (TPR) repeat protein